MGLTPQFTSTDVKAAIEKKLKAYHRAMLSRLMQAGEKFVALARNTNTYMDQTGNLRSSIGYIIVKDGVEVVRDFAVTGKGADGAAGVAKGESEAMKHLPAKGYCLIGVAGMEYAAAVEAKGKDVITGSSQVIESWLKNALKTLQGKI